MCDESETPTSHSLRTVTVMLLLMQVEDTVVVASLGSSLALQLQEISRLIEDLQQNEVKHDDRKDDQSQEIDENNGRIAISSRELDALINQAANDVFEENENNKRYLQDHEDNDNTIVNIHDGTQQNIQRNLIQDVLAKLSQESSLGVHSRNDVDLDDDDSKVYLILNPRAKLKQKDFKRIGKVLSQLLSDTNGEEILSPRPPVKRKPRYKGFAIADGNLLRRRNRESNELYLPKDSMEDYRPKRGRSEYGGGGRTPIPYIRHRDIYERNQ